MKWNPYIWAQLHCTPELGGIPCEYYKLMCKNGKCEINFHQLAESIGVFFSTGMICAGDEIGWDFVQSVLKFKTSFSGYCAEMTKEIHHYNG